MSKKTPYIVTGTVGAALAVGVGYMESGPSKSNLYEHYQCTPSEEVPIAKGETVSERFGTPLARELGITVSDALEILEYSNPHVKLGRVVAGQYISIPHCSKPDSDRSLTVRQP